MPPQNLPLWHEDYFEQEATENRCRKMPSRGSHYLSKSTLLGMFYAHEEDGRLVLRWTCTNNPYRPLISPYIFTFCYALNVCVPPRQIHILKP